VNKVGREGERGQRQDQHHLALSLCGVATFESPGAFPLQR
jgi:hypothetical protein